MTERWVEVLALIVLAWLVAVPVTRWFARVSWTAREPVAALVTWQAIGLCGGLAVLTAELTIAARGQPGNWRDGVTSALAGPGSVDAAGTVGLVLFVLSAGWLIGVLAWSFARAARTRREHRVLLELLSRPDREHDTSFDLIEAPDAVAYSVPGRDPRVVLTTAARDRLTSEQLHAVLAHERAHLRQRHSLLVQPFAAWERSLPKLAAPRASRARVEQLVEMVCDDAAVRVADAGALAGALAILAPAGPATTERLDRLPVHRRDTALRVLMLGVAAVAVVGPPLVLVLAG